MLTLEHALNEVFFSLHYNSCLLTIGMNTAATMMPFPGAFKVFDSHSRDVFGRPSALGYCVLISVEVIENLGEYFQLTSWSNAMIPLELKGVKCIDNDMQLELSARIIKNSKETTEQREFKLAQRREYNNSYRQNEMTQKREATLAKMREYKNPKREQKQVRLLKGGDRRVRRFSAHNNWRATRK